MWRCNSENPRAWATALYRGKHMSKQDRANEPGPARDPESPSFALLVGERLSIDAYSGSGELLHSSGQVIRDAWHLSRLLHPDTQFGEYHNVGVPEAPPTEEQAPPAPQLRDAWQARNSVSKPAAKAIAPEQMPEVFQQAYATKSESVKQVRTVFDRIEASGELNICDMEQTVCSLVDQVTSDGVATAAMTQLKDADAYTYCHSVNVCILAVYMGLSSDYQQEINYIGLGALLHDVGKLSIPMSVLRKNGPLNEQERGVVQEHPKQGLQLLHNAGCTNPIVQSCVLDHHEKLTGGGYPRRKAACEISPYAKIISLADVIRCTDHGPALPAGHDSQRRIAPDGQRHGSRL